MMRRLTFAVLIVAAFVSCGEPPVVAHHSSPDTRVARTYLALGDSYTIGEGVEPSQRWPAQLVNLLRANEVKVSDPEIIARTGWTTGELMSVLVNEPPGSDFDLVTLLIGVNDQYRGGEAETYRRDLAALLEEAVGFAGGEPSRVVVVSIPDWGVTPFAERRNRDVIARQIDEFNAIGRELATTTGTAWIDVTTFSREVGEHAPMTTDDGLHPSGMQYSEWARLILPAARTAISAK